MNDEEKPAKLEDVAAYAGISTATVSRYLNKPGVVSEAMAQKVREAIEATNYIPNALAGGLASNKSRTVAVMIPHLENSLFNDTIETMVDELTKSGNNVMLGLTGASANRTRDLVRTALARRVHAIISSGPVNEEIVEMVRRSKALFIQIWELPDSPVGLAIGFSHKDVGRDIARFLMSRGYARPHIITADGPRAHHRREAFMQEWKRLGGEEPTETLIDIPSRFGHARRVFSEMRRLPQMPDVVICGSDHLALGMIVEVQNAGLKVPDDIGVMGFGNSSIAGEMRPTMTTVEIDGARIAREAMAAIARYQEGEEFDTRMVDVGFRLIARESV